MNICGDCGKAFTPKRKNQIGKYCSQLCARRGARKIQAANRKAFLLSETSDERKNRLTERYERFVIKNGDEYCWDWSGHKKQNGYGGLKFDGKSMKAHRVSFEIHKGPIPDKLFCLHVCDVPVCTNPKHLFLGTNTDNVRDMIKKGRAVKSYGSKHYSSILNEEKVGKIKTLLKMGMRLASLARDYNVSGYAIWSIKHGLTWKSVNSS